MRNKIQIGKVNRLVIFGGGFLVVEFAKEARKRRINPVVFAAPRHLDEPLDSSGNTLKKLLKKESIPFFEASEIDHDPHLPKLVTHATIGIGLGETYTFEKRTIDLFGGKLFDFMVIDLPLYRGGAHFTWQILRGDDTGCWNIQMINEHMIPAKFDCGEIVKKRKYSVANGKTPQAYFDSAHKEGLKLFKAFLNDIQAKKALRLTKIDEEKSLFLPRISTANQAYINWSWNMDEIWRFICAFDDPYIGASTFLRGKRVFLKNCEKVSCDGPFHPFISGIIYRIRRDGIFIATKDGGLCVQKVNSRDGNAIKLSLGMRFYTPSRFLDNAALFEAEYDASGLKNDL